ncbi:MAG TPA: cytochrome-c oxidase, cbb3-type subunit III [Hyphomonadaceae bacterium]|jgi:cytochrome c oxidase cbb3-type subunit 3
MTDRSPEVDQLTGVETTGHEWDGIRELNNPLPRWWLWLFYASVVFSVIYWVLMPAWPALPGMQGHTPGLRGQSDRAEVAMAVDAMHASRAELSRKLAAADARAILADSELSQLALALGESTFGDNCATCHGAGGRGAKGYPQLADDVWLWGGTLAEIEYTIQNGVRSGVEGAHTNDMPAFGRDEFLTREQISDLVEYVTSLSGGEADPNAVRRSAPLFAENCASCHGDDGRGGKTQGAPNLTDAEWLYGGDRATIRATINGPRGGVMPAWKSRLDPATVRALAVYVHSMGGGS